MKLSVILKSFPNVKPRAAKAVLKSWESELYEPLVWDSEYEDELRVEICSGVTLLCDDFENLFCPEDVAPIEVTPYGAGLLVKIYNEGLLPMTKRAVPGEVPVEILEYAQRGEKLPDVRKRMHDQRTTAAAAYAEVLSNPSEVKPPFTYDLLNDLFIHHKGLHRGTTSMYVGCIEVTKTVVARSSNSGKSRDCEVTFSYTDGEGILRELNKPSRYGNNRRNDPKRNWGLPE